MSTAPLFQRRHYCAIAAMVANICDGQTLTPATLAQYLADQLSYDNPRFDRYRFMTACLGKVAV